MFGHVYNEVEECHILTIDREDLAALFSGDFETFRKNLDDITLKMLNVMINAEREASGI